MTYNTVAWIAYDSSIQRRVAACAAIEGLNNPVQWASARAWTLAARPGWADAWNTASDGHDTGSNESVITDAMILEAVQAIRSTERTS